MDGGAGARKTASPTTGAAAGARPAKATADVPHTGPGGRPPKPTPPQVLRAADAVRIAPGTLLPSGVRLSEPIRLIIGAGAVIEGGVFAAREVHTQARVQVRGPVRAHGTVLVGPRARVAGDVDAGADVRVLPDAEVGGGIRADGDVHLYDGCRVTGAVVARGDVIVWGGAATASVQAGGRVRTEPFPRGRPVAEPV